MDTALSRWEWRTFDDGVDAVAAHVHAITPDIRRSRDTYILSERSDVNTKIRSGLLDIKVLHSVDAHRLELWRPVMKLEFPLTSASLDTVLNIWGLAPRSDDRLWSLDALLQQIVARDPSLIRVDVEKTRRSFSVDECLVEIADLNVDGRRLRTAAVEMSDPERVWRTVVAFGVSSYENVNYVKALKRVLAVPV